MEAFSVHEAYIIEDLLDYVESVLETHSEKLLARSCVRMFSNNRGCNSSYNYNVGVIQ